MRYGGASLAEAVKAVVHGGGALQPGDGGVIAVDGNYNVAIELNSPGMYRGWATSNGDCKVAIFGTEEDGDVQ